MTLQIQYIKIKALPVYECLECGTLRQGSSSINLELTKLEQIKTLKDHVSNDHMPIGWAGYGRGKVRCEECKI